VSEKLPEG